MTPRLATVVVAVLAALLLVVPSASVAQASAPPIEDQLIDQLDGYRPLPETDEFGRGSGPVTADDLAETLGIDPSELPAGFHGYLRQFATPDARSRAVVIGIDVGAGKASDFLQGAENGIAANGHRVPFLPTAPAPLDGLAAYRFEANGITGWGSQ